ncbi:hypothetical protein CDD81_7095 [Ophiocordyceps australis]|uniref:Peptidase M48 domain-containing protein n=1 Tax=Ophiocordyceps australis TaxID=1399860 RepID=A0A2C5XH54_9HYPO|nr:hypothetical protein CDD81_7095 [Ophiocordyceps australis]
MLARRFTQPSRCTKVAWALGVFASGRASRSGLTPLVVVCCRGLSHSPPQLARHPNHGHHDHDDRHGQAHQDHAYLRQDHAYLRQHNELLRNARPLVSHSAVDRFSKVGSGRRQRLLVLGVIVLAVGYYLSSAQKVPATGRWRFNILSDDFVAASYAGSDDKFIAAIRARGGRFLSNWDQRARMAERVMKRLISVSGMDHLDWKITIIDDPKTANAFVLPGGKVFIFSGLLDVCGSEDALATVLGHEMAHNTASHCAERLSAAWVGNITLGSLFFLVGSMPGLLMFSMWNLIGGYYLQDLVFYLPMGRKQESEADYIGLMMMAEACYDPRTAIGFWSRMQQLSQQAGFELPEMFSTHPTNEHRVAQMKKWMPAAMKKRTESDCSGTSAFADRFRAHLRGGLPPVNTLWR